MNRKSKTIISVVLPIIILGAIILVYYLRQPDNIKNKPSEFQLSSRDLNREFIMNDSAAMAKYSSKIIEVTGGVANIKNSEMHGVIITLDDPMMGIKCVMDSSVTLPANLAIGSPVSIKGVCVGSDQLIGVMMNQCFITDSKVAAANP